MSVIINSNSINFSFGFKAFASSIQLNIEKHDREALFLAEVQRLTSQLDSFGMASPSPILPSMALIVRPSLHMIPIISVKNIAPMVSAALSVPTSRAMTNLCHVPIEMDVFDWPVYQEQRYFIELEPKIYFDEEDDDYDLNEGKLMFSSMVFDHGEAGQKHDVPSQEHFIIDLLELIQTLYQFMLSFIFTALFCIALNFDDRDVRFNQEVELLTSLVDSLEETSFVSSPGQPSPFNIVSIYQPWRQAKQKDEIIEITPAQSSRQWWLSTMHVIFLVLLYIHA